MVHYRMNKAFIFDFDDTLATTNARVWVKNKEEDSYPKFPLSPSEYAEGFELQDHEVYDYSEFRMPELIKEGEPTFLIHLAKEVYDEGHSVFILTARDDGVIETIGLFLEKHGIKAKTIYCVGGDHDPDIPAEKRKILLTLIEAYDKIYYYDDSKENVNHAPNHEKVRKYVL